MDQDQWLGGYRLIRRLGTGGAGTVWLAEDGAGERVALKLLHPALAATEAARERLARETTTVNRVASSGVAHVVDVEIDDSQPFVVTEFIDGPTLATRLRSGAMNSREVGALAESLRNTLQAVHDAGVVHRDVKPSNVILHSTGPVLIDFGIAMGPGDDRLTSTGLVSGTAGYAAPEVLKGADPGAPADWWAWASLLLGACTGRPPFGEGDARAVMLRVLEGQPDVVGLPPRIAQLFINALSPDVGRRPEPSVLAAHLVDDSAWTMTAPASVEPHMVAQVTEILDLDPQGNTEWARARDHSATEVMESGDQWGEAEEWEDEKYSDEGGDWEEDEGWEGNADWDDEGDEGGRAATEVLMSPSSMEDPRTEVLEAPRSHPTQPETRVWPIAASPPYSPTPSPENAAPWHQGMGRPAPGAQGPLAPEGTQPMAPNGQVFSPAKTVPVAPGQWGPQTPGGAPWETIQPYSPQNPSGTPFVGVIVMAGLAVLPVVMANMGSVLVLVVLMVLAGLGSGHKWREERRRKADGPRPSDTGVALAASPRHLLFGVLSVVPGLLAGGGVGGVAWYLLNAERIDGRDPMWILDVLVGPVPALSQGSPVTDTTALPAIWLIVTLALVLGWVFPASKNLRRGLALVVRATLPPLWSRFLFGLIIVAVLVATWFILTGGVV